VTAASPAAANEGLLRRVLLALAALSIVVTAVELATDRHWETFVQRIPWFALLVATAALLQDPQSSFDVTTRASLSALMDWTLGRFEVERAEITAGDSSSLAMWLFASSELQR
jgi:hypothetical protein